MIVMAKGLQPTRTTGPLHFEDLEPHRFEDLIRRLVYDFRPWRQLEATGRSGSDDGFDARGFEIASGAPPFENGDDAAPEDEVAHDRVWLIQCKREKSVSPKKLGQYLDAIPTEEAGTLYGIVFAAACDFSKAARDLFRARTRELGVAEAHLWGKGELEDMLYQPKNDDVLFTFFGISKRIRLRSLSAEVRRRLAVKRKAQRVLEGYGIEVLVRDARDERYPYADENETDKVLARRWCVYRFDGCHYDGLHLLRKRCLAFVDDDGVAWDYAEETDDPPPRNNPWRTEEDERLIRELDEVRAAAMATWDAFPEKNRAWLEEWLVLPYENIIDIDEKGDEWFDGPHIYVSEFDPMRGPFRDYRRVKLATIGQWSSRQAQPNPETRIVKFARDSKPRR
jgi:hypothetical protein